MKLFLLASLLVASSSAAALAQCRNGWCKGGCAVNQDSCAYVKPLNRGYPIRRVKHTNDATHIMDFDCQQPRWRIVWEDGSLDPWIDVNPGTVMEVTFEVACAD